MAARKTTKTAVIDPNMVTISDFCQTQGINEQIFRLELMQHCDNADSTKTCDFSIAQQVASTLTAPTKALPQTVETAETSTPQELQPAQETAPQAGDQHGQNISENSQIATTQSDQALGTSTKNAPTKGNLPSALEELIQESEEVIQLADLVHTYRNQQIIQNAQARDSELVVQLRERRIETRNQTFDRLRDLNSKQPIAPELPELPSSLTDEIKALSDELGKSLVVG